MYDFMGEWGTPLISKTPFYHKSGRTPAAVKNAEKEVYRT
jgi:hypothetical protein